MPPSLPFFPSHNPLDLRNRRVRTRKPEQRIPRISRALVPRPERLDLKLGLVARVNSFLRRLAHVDQLVADSVRDDERVQGLLLAFRNEGVLRDEGELVRRTAVKTADAGDGRLAEAEVEAGGANGATDGGIVVLDDFFDVVLNNVLNIVDDVLDVLLDILLDILLLIVFVIIIVTVVDDDYNARPTLMDLSASTNFDVLGRRNDAGTVARRRVLHNDLFLLLDGVLDNDLFLFLAGTGGRSTTLLAKENDFGSISSNGSEVGEALLDHDLSLGQANGGKGGRDGRLGVDIGNVRATDGGVDEGQNATKSLRHGEVGVGADKGHINGEGVEVGLGSDEGNGRVKNGLVIAKFLDEGVGDSELDC